MCCSDHLQSSKIPEVKLLFNYNLKHLKLLFNYHLLGEMDALGQQESPDLLAERINVIF